MTKLEAAEEQLSYSDITSTIENDTLYVLVGDYQLELADYEITFRANLWREDRVHDILSDLDFQVGQEVDEKDCEWALQLYETGESDSTVGHKFLDLIDRTKEDLSENEITEIGQQLVIAGRFLRDKPFELEEQYSRDRLEEILFQYASEEWGVDSSHQDIKQFNKWIKENL
jgi:hypothetical protein